MTRRNTSPDDLANAVLAGDRRALSRAITIVESTRPDHRAMAEALLARIMPKRPSSLRIGITGAPGAGKSTFIEAFGAHVTGQGHRIAVLAVDPSSSRTGGSILGDKTRMPVLSRNPAAFIRPSPSGHGAGGVAQRTRDALPLVEAAGFDVVLVETVGVGQSEYAVADMVDLFMLLLSPGGGDELQGIKRGIMELADLVLVNKADGDLLTPARHAASDYRSALTLIRPKYKAWRPEVLMVSALTEQGIGEVWEAVCRFRAALEEDGTLDRQRAEQAVRWLRNEIEAGLLQYLRTDPRRRGLLGELEQAVTAGRISPSQGARQMLHDLLGEDIEV